MRCCTFALVFALIATTAADGDDVLPHRQDRPPNRPHSPQEALRRFTVPDGFRVELVAAEPDLVNPIAMTFDDRGRIWVTESVEYPRKFDGPGRDRVKLLEDADGDGTAEKVTVVVEGLNIPCGVAVGYGGVWVLNSPDLLFIREEGGKEISREVVVTGFGRADTHELPSSLTWGPDGWLYGLNGVFNPSRVKSSNGREYAFTCAMWRVHPRTREFQVFAEGTSNPYGIAWDAEGSAIVEVCHWANDHLFHFVETGYYQRQAGAYPPFAMKVGSITDHGHQKTAYCGIARLDSPHFPEPYRGRIVVGNIHGGCVNVDRLQRDGSTYVARAEPDLLTANDVWFMPVSLKVGPDGCLYVLDWYDRYHCSQDGARDPAGVDRLRGRLYRLRYKDAPRAGALDLATESDEQLIARLGSENVFFRESAQRLLSERLPDDRLRESLQAVVLERERPRRSRLHALWALIGGGRLGDGFHGTLLQDPDPAVRAWAVRAAGDDRSSPAGAAAMALASDRSPDVQLQVAIAARKIDGVDPLATLVDVLAHCGHDKLIPAIVWQNLHTLLETDGSRFAGLLMRPGRATTMPPAAGTLMPRIIDRLLAAREPDVATAAALIRYASRSREDLVPACVGAVSARVDSLDARGREAVARGLRPLIEEALLDERPTPLRLAAELLGAKLKVAAVDPSAVRRRFLADDKPAASRLQALEAMVALRDEGLLDAVARVLPAAPPAFAAKALAVLGRVEDPKLAEVVLARYPTLAAETKPLAVELLMQREPWARKLLDAVLAGRMPRSALDANHLRKILDSNDREALWAVEKAFGRVREERNPEREKVVAEMAAYLRRNPGDPVAGRRVFQTLCAQCHTIYGAGGGVGPDLTGNGRGTFEQLVSSVFDPSLVIGPQYQVTTIVTRDGRNLTGLVTEDGDQRIVVRMAGEGEEAVPRNNVKFTRVSKLSMMPEGIEAMVSREDLADLFAFLSLDRPPEDPAAKPVPGAPAPVGTSAPAPRPSARQ